MYVCILGHHKSLLFGFVVILCFFVSLWSRSTLVSFWTCIGCFVSFIEQCEFQTININSNFILRPWPRGPLTFLCTRAQLSVHHSLLLYTVCSHVHFHTGHQLKIKTWKALVSRGEGLLWRDIIDQERGGEERGGGVRTSCKHSTEQNRSFSSAPLSMARCLTSRSAFRNSFSCCSPTPQVVAPGGLMWLCLGARRWDIRNGESVEQTAHRMDFKKTTFGRYSYFCRDGLWQLITNMVFICNRSQERTRAQWRVGTGAIRLML